MAEQSLIQFRADKELKQRASEICAALGTDLPTVFRMCMKQMEIVNGIPFPTRLPENVGVQSIFREEQSERDKRTRIGIARGEFTVPDDIDVCNDEIAEMFGVNG